MESLVHLTLLLYLYVCYINDAQVNDSLAIVISYNYVATNHFYNNDINVTVCTNDDSYYTLLCQRILSHKMGTYEVI